MIEVDQEDFEELRLEISRMARSEEGIRDVLWMLARTDWESIFLSDQVNCWHCHTKFPFREMVWQDGEYLRFCPECLAGDGERRCYRCGTMFCLPVTNRLQVCSDCQAHVCAICRQSTQLPPNRIICQPCLIAKGLSDGWERSESVKVQTHGGRARSLGKSGILSLRQWLTTLEDFQWQCAYCRSAPYECVEHFIPLCKDGDTIAQNCVPACYSCNKRKGQRLPENVTSIPQEAFSRVRIYLQNRQ